MFRLVAGIVALGLALPSRDALACDRPPPGTPEQELRKTKAVFLAEVAGVRRFRPPRAEESIEIVEFRVLKVWKGPFRVGRLVTFRTPVEPTGGCNFNVLNDPRWMDGNGDLPAILPKTWIIYVPSLDELVLRDSRTFPLDGAMLREEVRELDQAVARGGLGGNGT